MSEPGAPGSLSYAEDLKPLFREQDRAAMTFAFDLWEHKDVAANAREILARLEDGSMPCDSEWPEEQVQTFRRWLEAGMPA